MSDEIELLKELRDVFIKHPTTWHLVLPYDLLHKIVKWKPPFVRTALEKAIRAKEWADWVLGVAMDEDGVWHAYEEESRPIVSGWDVGNGKFCELSATPMPSVPSEHWKETWVQIKEVDCE